jgi:hypothetical protein
MHILYVRLNCSYPWLKAVHRDIQQRPRFAVWLFTFCLAIASKTYRKGHWIWVSHSSDCDEYGPRGYNATHIVWKERSVSEGHYSSTFRLEVSVQLEANRNRQHVELAQLVPQRQGSLSLNSTTVQYRGELFSIQIHGKRNSTQILKFWDVL